MRTRIGLMLFLVWAVACTEDADNTQPTPDVATSDTATSDAAPSDTATPTDTTAPDATPADVPAPDAVLVDTNTPDAAPADTASPSPLGGCCDPAAGANACEGSLICLDVPNGTPTCHQPAGNAICNVDEDCGVGGVCEGVSLCDCEVDCMTEMGTCAVTGFPKACCSNNADCGDGGLMCVGGENNAGICKPVPPPVYGPCWNDKACMDGDICVGAQLCPCNADCDMDDQIGACEADPIALPCAVSPPVGCNPDDDCGEDNVCMFTDQCLPSSCTCDPADGQWQCTADCAAGACAPEEEACGTPNPVGCKNDDQCPTGQVCFPPMPGECKPGGCHCSSANGTVGPWTWMCTKDCVGSCKVPL